jgi:hypothetical protein
VSELLGRIRRAGELLARLAPAETVESRGDDLEMKARLVQVRAADQGARQRGFEAEQLDAKLARVERDIVAIAPGLDVGVIDQLADEGEDQIGRASCRERVS